jgi:endonuclease/exonuclease/phosphatase family metal-dependent hydrolase
MLALNCAGARARVQAESELEEASKRVEVAFAKIQLREVRRGQVEAAIQDTREKKLAEMSAHVDWLAQERARLAAELAALDQDLADKKLRLQERAA